MSVSNRKQNETRFVVRRARSIWGCAEAADALRHGRRFLLLAMLAYLAVLSVGSVVEPPQLVRDTGSLLVHMLAFALAPVFVFLLTPRARVRLRLILLLFLFGVGIEVVQYFLPWRSATWADLLYNATGLLLGCLACLSVEVLARRLTRQSQGATRD